MPQLPLFSLSPEAPAEIQPEDRQGDDRAPAAIPETSEKTNPELNHQFHSVLIEL